MNRFLLVGSRFSWLPTLRLLLGYRLWFPLCLECIQLKTANLNLHLLSLVCPHPATPPAPPYKCPYGSPGKRAPTDLNRDHS